MEPTLELDPLISWPVLRPIVGNVDYSTWWRAMQRGEAPKPVRITRNRVGWRQSDIREWLQSREGVAAAA